MKGLVFNKGGKEMTIGGVLILILVGVSLLGCLVVGIVEGTKKNEPRK